MSSLSERRTEDLLSFAADRLFAVGSVQQSVLSEVQFQAQQGTKWVLMDGRDITGSELATITGWTNLPDASGRFLRSSGGDANATLGGLQTQSTAKNGLQLSGSAPSLTANSFASDNHTHGSSSMTAQITRDGSNGMYSEPRVSSSQFTTTDVLNANGGGVDSTLRTNATAVAGDTDGPSSSTNVSITGGAYSLSSTDTETRPINITVNTFIKIN